MTSADGSDIVHRCKSVEHAEIEVPLARRLGCPGHSPGTAVPRDENDGHILCQGVGSTTISFSARLVSSDGEARSAAGAVSR